MDVASPVLGLEGAVVPGVCVVPGTVVVPGAVVVSGAVVSATV